MKENYVTCSTVTGQITDYGIKRLNKNCPAAAIKVQVSLPLDSCDESNCANMYYAINHGIKRMVEKWGEQQEDDD